MSSSAFPDWSWLKASSPTCIFILPRERWPWEAGWQVGGPAMLCISLVVGTLRPVVVKAQSKAQHQHHGACRKWKLSDSTSDLLNQKQGVGWGGGGQTVFNKPSRWFRYTIQFNEHHLSGKGRHRSWKLWCSPGRDPLAVRLSSRLSGPHLL